MTSLPPWSPPEKFLQFQVFLRLDVLLKSTVEPVEQGDVTDVKIFLRIKNKGYIIFD